MTAFDWKSALGLDDRDKIVVVHQDDIGMCHGANTAFRTLAGDRFVTCGSVMVPCPWFMELAEMAGVDPTLDIGVHLTLTSEWRCYRWRPLTGASKASGLVDDDGFMWPRVAPLREAVNVAAAEAELRAQIDAALEAGIDVTHLDGHMCAAMAPELIDVYARLGRDYDAPTFMPGAFDDFACTSSFGPYDAQALNRRADAQRGQGRPLVVDAAHETPWVAADKTKSAYQAMIGGVAAGVTFLALHPNAPGDIEAIDPERAHCRVAEFAMFQDAAFLDWVDGLGLKRIGFRAIRDAWRLSSAGSDQP